MLDKVCGDTGGQTRAPSVPSQIGRIQPAAAAAEVVNAANLVRKLDGFCLQCFFLDTGGGVPRLWGVGGRALCN